MRAKLIPFVRPTSSGLKDEGAVLAPSPHSASGLDADRFEKAPSMGSQRPSTHVIGGLIDAIARPIVKNQRELAKAIGFIGNPPLTVKKLEQAEKILAALLKKSSTHDEAKLWLAICGRLRGKDATKEFKEILKKNPYNRLAFLNLAANYLSAPLQRYDEARAAHEDIKRYLSKEPNDNFAQYIDALMTRKFMARPGEAIKILEEIYLRDRSYSVGISTMGAILYNFGNHVAGSDFALEAAKLNPWNYQAIQLAGDKSEVTKNADYAPLDHVIFIASCGAYDSMLHASYFLQDPFTLQIGFGQSLVA